MRYILFLLIAMLQLPLFAQNGADKANALLDRALAGLKADVPVRMDYTYRVLDEDGEALQQDRGVMYVDNGRYALLMQEMKVWCDGMTQWSYMREVDEVYVTDAVSDEAQNLSPLHIMEHYRTGRAVSLVDDGAVAVVTLQPMADDGMESVELHIRKNGNRLVKMVIYMPGQGSVEVLLDGYAAKCGADSSVFVCPVDEFRTAEIIDMR